MTAALVTGASLDEVNVHLLDLEAAGLLGIVEVGGRATCYFPDRIDGLPVAGRWEDVADQDWAAAWKAGIEPVTVGAITITPPWIPVADVPGRPPPEVVIVVEPAQAFGTGHHETTTGCLAALQELDLRGRRVLDVGTGTGVLAIAAARLGARAVVATDTDPLAVAAARENAETNGVEVDVRQTAAESGTVLPAAAGADAIFDLVVANLDTATLSGLAGEIVAHLAPGGTLIASGVSVERSAEAVAAFAAAGLTVAVRRGREWVVLTGRR